MYKFLLIIIVISILFIFSFYKIEYFNNKSTNWNNLMFTEKLKLYRKSIGKNESIYADKLKVKKILKAKNIDNLFIPKTIKVLDKNSLKLDIDSLPKKCIIKSSHGWNDIIFINDGKIKKMIARGKTLENNINNYKIWHKKSIKSHNSNENHYQYIEPNFFVEEYLGDNINDYKFFCFHGECKFFHIDFGRFKKRCRNVYDKKLNILDFNEKGLKKCDFKVELPSNINKMILLAEQLSKDFEFVRIDLYNINNKIYFSEFTFVPAAGNTPFHPIKYEYEIGKYWV